MYVVHACGVVIRGWRKRKRLCIERERLEIPSPL
jgi:hypothetical protein